MVPPSLSVLGLFFLSVSVRRALKNHRQMFDPRGACPLPLGCDLRPSAPPDQSSSSSPLLLPFHLRHRSEAVIWNYIHTLLTKMRRVVLGRCDAASATRKVERGLFENAHCSPFEVSRNKKVRCLSANYQLYSLINIARVIIYEKEKKKQEKDN